MKTKIAFLFLLFTVVFTACNNDEFEDATGITTIEEVATTAPEGTQPEVMTWIWDGDIPVDGWVFGKNPKWTKDYYSCGYDGNRHVATKTKITNSATNKTVILHERQFHELTPSPNTAAQRRGEGIIYQFRIWSGSDYKNIMKTLDWAGIKYDYYKSSIDYNFIYIKRNDYKFEYENLRDEHFLV
ncbi:hypothetical protein Barb4_00334 [Bacteroidales bacterium Barb4]|nr:hypothetical protein Barb4_00334 [Bacteroidales bacterium Barb4]